MFSQYDDIMSVEDVMEALDIGRSKVYELLRSRKIKSFKMKGYRIPKVAVKDFVLSEAKLNMERFKELTVD
ncbi:helix-turn-helix domain-containing protein [Paenibacillus sp. ISL-20]|uniref:helix-turn-helix domain-containing protein n=1 Tax=Paenibacillus sp. ISL-20 TaxID=2819163 RepID=UPI001BECDD71|nr:helix-turn-helix domain-containing protein [Paenibacillus sp. ISL-20]MBT2762410.1 helix-turn-helix domain-containing protein [Paenibacillus sp. ISL-20]